MEAKEFSGNINIMLPDELLLHVFKFLCLDDILVCEDVCQRWSKLAHDSSLWRRILVTYSGKSQQTESNAKALQIITSHYKYILNLRLQYVYSLPIIESILEKCDNLHFLELVMCRIRKDFEVTIKKWPNLVRLNLRNSILLQSNEDVVIQYDQFKDLFYLALSEFGLNSNNCDSLLHCSKLSYIYIEKIRDLKLDFIKELIKSKQYILECLHIYGGDAVDDQCLVMLSKCPKLKDLAIIRCENLTDEGLVNLVNLKLVNYLQIWNNDNFTETNLLHTFGHSNLIKMQGLSLSRIKNISPVIVDVISEYYKNLKFLAVYQCPKIINTDYEKQLKSKFRNIDVVLY